MSQTVAGTLVEALEQIGVRHIFGLIGDSLNPLADAVRHSKIEWIGVRHEEGAALAAGRDLLPPSSVFLIGASALRKLPLYLRMVFRRNSYVWIRTDRRKL